MSPAYACSLGVVHAMIRKPLIPYGQIYFLLRASAGHPQITYFSTAHTDIVHSRDTQDVKMKQQRVADSFASPPRLMELERAAAYVGLGRTKFSEMVKAGHMPKPVDLDRSPRL